VILPAHRVWRLLPERGAVPVVLADHLARHGLPPGCPALIEMLRDAGLTGRDRSGRPVHAVLAEAVAALRSGGTPVVLARAELGEPASRKDTGLLWMSPHLVLDGLQLAAAAVGVPQARLCLGRQPNGRLRDSLEAALADRAKTGLNDVPVEITDASGEPAGAGPATEPPAGPPVLVANVETLAHVALIARYGAAWFRSVGTDTEPGTMLCTVRQLDGQTDIVEAAIGAPVGDLVTLDRHTQAVLAGGYHGVWLPAAQAASLPLSNAGLRQAQLRLPGASVGAGVLAALPDDRCGLAETSRLARYLAAESRFGAARLVHGAMGVFGEEVRLHEKGRCRASGNRPFLPVPLRLRAVPGPRHPASRRAWERI
jgi:NADH:ubiquinone oxidoreductase subunit F (NADH-binding)